MQGSRICGPLIYWKLSNWNSLLHLVYFTLNHIFHFTIFKNSVLFCKSIAFTNVWMNCGLRTFFYFSVQPCGAIVLINWPSNRLELETPGVEAKVRISLRLAEERKGKIKRTHLTSLTTRKQTRDVQICWIGPLVKTNCNTLFGHITKNVTKWKHL